MKKLDIIVGAVVVIGALNWGLVGVFNFDIVAAIFGAVFGRVVYSLIGIAALYDILMIKQIGKRWDIHLRRPAHM